MDRLPKRFEEEVLSKHGVEWKECADDEFEMITSDGYNKSDYEIAAIGLEAIMENGDLETKLSDGNMFEYCFENEKIMVQDKDFCQCIFKAIKEIYEN